MNSLLRGRSLRIVSLSHYLDQFLDSRGRPLKRRSFFGSQVDLNDLFNPALAKFHRDTDEQAVDAVLAFEISGARENLLLVLQYRFDHFDRGGRWGVISRTGL